MADNIADYTEADLYKEIPASVCREGCYSCCCNSVQFTKNEAMCMGVKDYMTVDGHCPYVKEDGHCAVYENRPLICRLYGTSVLMKCSDCVPERFLTEEETGNLVHRYIKLMT